METESEVRMSGGREFHRRGADRLKALDPMVVWSKELVGRGGSESSGRCVDVNKFHIYLSAVFNSMI